MLDKLVACAGIWKGVNTLQDPNTGQPEASPSTAIVSPILDGRFVRLEYTWAHHGTAQAGELLIGYEAEKGVFTCHWVDTWHMGDKVMACRSTSDDRDIISVLGSFSTPDGPDWGWRTDVIPEVAESLSLAMFSISPEEEEFPAVEAHYTRG